MMRATSFSNILLILAITAALTSTASFMYDLYLKEMSNRQKIERHIDLLRDGLNDRKEKVSQQLKRGCRQLDGRTTGEDSGAQYVICDYVTIERDSISQQHNARSLTPDIQGEGGMVMEGKVRLQYHYIDELGDITDQVKRGSDTIQFESSENDGDYNSLVYWKSISADKLRWTVAIQAFPVDGTLLSWLGLAPKPLFIAVFFSTSLPPVIFTIVLWSLKARRRARHFEKEKKILNERAESVVHEQRKILNNFRPKIYRADDNTRGQKFKEDVKRLVDDLEGIIGLRLSNLSIETSEHRTEFDMTRLLKRLADETNYTVGRGRNAIFIDQRESNEPYLVFGKMKYLQSAFENMLENARVHGGGDIELRLRLEEGEYFIVEVADQGHENQERPPKEKFERVFFRERGGGIGLPDVAAAAHQHGSPHKCLVEADMQDGGGWIVRMHIHRRYRADSG